VTETSDFKIYQDSGFAFFDDPVKTEEGGWLSRAGAPSTRFDIAAQLLPPTLWITNIEWNEFSKSGFAGAGHIRRANWLRTTPRTICNEIGYPMNGIGNKRAAELLSEIYNRVNEMAWSFFPDMKPQASLSKTILQLIRDMPADESVLRERRLLESATQDYSTVPQDAWDPELVTVSFVPNRVNYFGSLLNMPVPSGKIERLKAKFSTKDFVLAEEPLVAQIELVGSPANLCAFGHQGFRSATPRRCVTQIEALMLIESIEIKIEKVWRMGDIAPAPLLLHIPSIENIPFMSDSYSLGLLFEAMTLALMEKSYDKRLPANDNYYLRQRAVYLKSVDRTLCYGLAKKLKSQGISRLFNYGMGQVSARIIKDDLREAQQIAADCGFMLLAYEV
jgi:hypothetical protein